VTASRRTSRVCAEAIEASLEVAARCAGDLTPRVYALLFAREPQLRELFWRDTDGAIKGEMLMKVIEMILDFIGERRYADHFIRAEAANHSGYEVAHDLFATFFALVAGAVAEACGDEWTQSMRTAWSQLIRDLDDFVTAPEPALTAS
jgi:hemoglobin-like flavoprotein